MLDKEMNLQQALYLLKNAEDEAVRVQSAKSIGQHYNTDQDALMALVEALADPEEVVQGEAMCSLKLMHLNPLPYLYNALETGQETMRWSVCELLGSFPGDETELALMSALNDVSSHVRGAAARSLGKMAISKLTQAKLTDMLNDPEPFPRYEALSTLNIVAPNETNEMYVLLRDIQSLSPKDKIAAIHFIRASRRTGWAGELRNLAIDSDAGVRYAAVWALEHVV